MLRIILGFVVGYHTAKLVVKYGSWSAATSATIAKVKSLVATVTSKS
jgi:hypothetical protein